jgi:KaiC/GvpD/RAD55 family RecA-like ATPase
MLLLVSIQGAAASSYQDISQVPLFIHLFLLTNIFLLTAATVMIHEVKKVSVSTVWNDLSIANLFCLFHVVGLAAILHRLYFIMNANIKGLIAVLCTYAVIMVYTGEYMLIKQLIKEKINVLTSKYILPSTFLSFIIWYFFATFISLVEFPMFHKTILFDIFILLFIFVDFWFLYGFLALSKSYAKLGFVSKPFFAASTGAFVLFLYSVIVFYLARNFHLEYYYLILWLIPNILGLTYYLNFAVEYPSLLQPKWKTLLPFDLPRVTAALTLAFLATSLYITAKEYPNFIIYQNIPYLFVVAFLLPVFLGVILILTYLKNISARAKLRYWSFLKYGLYTHLTVTLYLFSLIFLSWNNATGTTRMLFAMFGVVSFAFYIFFALDLRTILEDQNIEPTFDRLDLSRYLVFLYSFFFLLFFGISFTYRDTFGVVGNRFELLSYPIILFLTAFFIFAFVTYMSVTHKGFEEIMRKNIWSELSYLAAFIAFILVYFIYFSLSTYLQRFPYHDLFFIGYLLVLIIEIASISTLGLESKYQKTGAKDIIQLLNSHAHRFLRTDYLEDLWEKTRERYVTEDDVTGIRFDSSRRRFDLEKTNEPTRLKIAVEILLGMHKLSDLERIAIMEKSIEETREEIVDVINEKVLMLPDDLRCEFDESVYYPILYEKVVNNLLKHLKAFVPLSEQRKIFDQLKKRDEKFKCISFEKEGIRIEDGTRFSRDDFLKLFRFYFDSIEEKFPFKAFLLYEVVREEIKSSLEPYHITAGELLDVAPTGLEDMDEIMAGGLAKRSSTLFIAEEMKTKHRILISFVKQGLREGNTVIYVNSKRPSKQIMDELRMDVEDLKNFVIIDFYQDIYTEERVSELMEEDYRIIAPLNKILFQRSIVKRIKSQPRDTPKIVVIDVYDDFSRYYNPKEILELLQNQLEGFKRWNCTSLIAVDPYSYLMRKEGVEEVKKDFDNVIILSGEDKDASIFIEKLYHGTPSKHIIRLHL